MAKINNYTTAIMRFINKSASLSTKNISWIEFCKLVNDAFEKLKLDTKPDLYSPYFKQMISIADSILCKISQENGEVADFHSWISKEINQLEKQKRVKKYSRKKSLKDLE